MINLPQLSVWNRLKMPFVIVQSPLIIQVRTNGFLLRKESKWMSCHCLLTNKGYFVIYVKENECKGYAVNLSRAKKLNVLFEKSENLANTFDDVKKNLINLFYFFFVD